MNLRPLGYEPSELPNCSTPRRCVSKDYRWHGVDANRGTYGLAVGVAVGAPDTDGDTEGADDGEADGDGDGVAVVLGRAPTPSSAWMAAINSIRLFVVSGSPP